MNPPKEMAAFEPGSECKVLLSGYSTEEIRRELMNRIKQKQGLSQAAHGKLMNKQKRKTKNRAKRRNK